MCFSTLVLAISVTSSSPPSSLTEDEQKILSAADYYDGMSYGSSRTVFADNSGNWSPSESTYQTMYAEDACTVTKNLTGPEFDYEAEAGLMHIATDPTDTPPIGKVDVSVGTVNAGAHAGGTDNSVDAGASIISGTVGPIDFKIGVDGKTGVSYKDDSWSGDIAGTGVTVGRKIGISAGDLGSVDVDLKTLFDPNSW